MNLKFIPTLFILLTGCSSLVPDYVSYYYADTTSKGGKNCAPQFTDKSSAESYVTTMSSDDQKKFESHTGYSNCTHTKASAQTYIISCNSPTKYKRLTTLSLAECDKFITENNLK